MAPSKCSCDGQTSAAERDVPVGQTAPGTGLGRPGRRNFNRSGPNQLWVTDITEHPPGGKAYCAVVPDAYSRRVVGWSIDASPTAALVTHGLGMAIDFRTLPAGAVIHSDRGVQFGSWAFTNRAKASGLVPSMGSIADCFNCETSACRPAA